MNDRLFTLDEARALVPWLQQTFDDIDLLRQKLEQIEQEMQALMMGARTNGHGSQDNDIEARRRVHRDVQALMESQHEDIVNRGILVRSVEQGLVDFPAVRDGQSVYLCWIKGEPDIAFYHDMETGFAGRQPL